MSAVGNKLEVTGTEHQTGFLSVSDRNHRSRHDPNWTRRSIQNRDGTKTIFGGIGYGQNGLTAENNTADLVRYKECYIAKGNLQDIYSLRQVLSVQSTLQFPLPRAAIAGVKQTLHYQKNWVRLPAKSSFHSSSPFST